MDQEVAAPTLYLVADGRGTWKITDAADGDDLTASHGTSAYYENSNVSGLIVSVDRNLDVTFTPKTVGPNELPDPVKGVITLTGDVTLESSYEVNDNITIDLAGNTLTVSKEGSDAISVAAGKKLTLKNGTLAAPASTSEAVRVEENGSLEVEGMTITGKTRGITAFVAGDAENKTGGTITIKNSTIIGEESDGVSISGNYDRIDVTVNDSTITSGKYDGMYLPSKGTTVVNNSTITGVTSGIAIKGGTLELNNSTLKATSDTSAIRPTPPEGGSVVTGPALSVEPYTGGSKRNVKVTAYGTTFENETGPAIKFYIANNTTATNIESGNSILINGGNATTDKILVTGAVSEDKFIVNNTTIEFIPVATIAE